MSQHLEKSSSNESEPNEDNVNMYNKPLSRQAEMII